MKINKFKEFFLKRKLDKYNIKNYTINSNGNIDVDGDVNLNNKSLTEIPFIFGKVTGSFYCHDNELTSLEGCPYFVGGSFDCYNNCLKNLKYSPSEVGKLFDCSRNYLTSLEGMPSEIGGDFYCVWNNIKELDSVSNIEGIIHCDQIVDISKFQGYCKNMTYDYDRRKFSLFSPPRLIH